MPATLSRLPCRPAIALFLALSMAAGLLAGCMHTSDKQAETPPPLPIWPAEPDLPRYTYETALRAPGDILNPDDPERMRRNLTGDDMADKPAFEKPAAIVAGRGRVYVADIAQRRVAVFDIPRRRFFRFGFRQPAVLGQPSGLALDDAMNVYVADAQQRRVFVFDPLGLPIRSIGSKDEFERPTGVAVSRDGTRIYVVDRAQNESDNHRVIAFDAAGSRLWSIGSRGSGSVEFNIPLQAAVGPDGSLHVLDAGNFRVQTFDAEGHFLRSTGRVGSGSGAFSRPRGIAVDKDGKIFVSDAGFNNVQVFDRDGRLLMSIGRASLQDRPGQYALLAGVAADETGRVYVVDQYFNKVEVIRPLTRDEAIALRPNAEE